MPKHVPNAESPTFISAPAAGLLSNSHKQGRGTAPPAFTFFTFHLRIGNVNPNRGTACPHRGNFKNWKKREIPGCPGKGQFHSSIASELHSSTQAPQSTHLDSSMTAMSSMVIASWGHASAHAPHATQFSAMILGICYTSSVLNSFRRTLVNTGSAVDAFGFVDDCDIVYGDCALGARVCACSACDTVVSNDFCHISNKIELSI